MAAIPPEAIHEILFDDPHELPLVIGVTGHRDLVPAETDEHEQTLRDWSLIGAFALGIILFVKKNHDPISYCDIWPERLDRMRVNAGLIVGWLLAVQAILINGRSAGLDTPIWACIIATIASRRNGTKPARPQTRLEQPLRQNDIR